MNNYGVILNYIGLEPFITDLFDTYLTKIAEWVYPSDEPKNDTEMKDEDLDFTFHGTLDHHHTFMVQYKMDADLFLDMHIDDSEVTFNINLLDKFEGAELAICGLTERQNEEIIYYHINIIKEGVWCMLEDRDMEQSDYSWGETKFDCMV